MPCIFIRELAHQAPQVAQLIAFCVQSIAANEQISLDVGRIEIYIAYLL